MNKKKSSQRLTQTLDRLILERHVLQNGKNYRLKNKTDMKLLNQLLKNIWKKNKNGTCFMEIHQTKNPNPNQNQKQKKNTRKEPE